MAGNNGYELPYGVLLADVLCRTTGKVSVPAYFQKCLTNYQGLFHSNRLSLPEKFNPYAASPESLQSAELFIRDVRHPGPEDSDRGRTYNPMLSKLEKLNKGLEEIADRHRVATAQIILRWNVRQGVIVIPKSVHRERIGSLDKNCPSMLDTRKVSEVRRVYDYLNNPVLTSL